MSRLKVLMLGWEFPPVINGGLGIACLGMAKAMSKHVDLSIILPKTDPDFRVNNVELIGLNHVEIDEFKAIDSSFEYSTFEDVEFIESEILPYKYDERTRTVTNEISKKGETRQVYQESRIEDLDLFKSPELYGDDVIYKVIQYAKYAAKLALKKEFDVIHAHDWMTFLAGVEIQKQSGKPLAVHVHSLSYDRSGADSRGWVYDVEKYGMEQANMVIPVSHYTGKICRDHYGINESKITAVHNGADPVKVYHQEKTFPDKLVLFLGRVTLQKGPEIFLEIASKVIAKNKHVRFVMAGTGDKLKRIIESGAFNHVGDKFHFTGFLNKEKVNRLLSMADVYCMPSVSEPFGLSALEAAQFGIPAVISKQSGVAEVLHGALKADYWDVELMAQHILDVIEDEKLNKEVVDAGFEDLKQLNWENAAEKLVPIFEAHCK